MLIRRLPKPMTALLICGVCLGVSACDPNAVGVSGGVYYDSMLWNDYYYGRPRPPNPPRPEHPIERPPRPVHPIAPPPVARPPIHRPPVARPRPGRF